ncbi:hypothetical protein R1flu_002326 [Riccia fluitans]|uniref:Uncharacterized protein n=1 Tax=Riccia fluitans TaxID=41844 RepID=A0ABD1Y5V9_9MARC
MGPPTRLSTISIYPSSQLSCGHFARPLCGHGVRFWPKPDILVQCEPNSNDRFNASQRLTWFCTLISQSLCACSVRFGEPRHSALVSNLTAEERAEVLDSRQTASQKVKHILCLNNGHGEDTFAVSTLKELMAIAGERGQKIDWQAIVRWSDTPPDAVILAVGDIFPLALAWLASFHEKKKQKRVFQYAFIGTAKSEYTYFGNFIDGQACSPQGWVKLRKF